MCSGQAGFPSQFREQPGPTTTAASLAKDIQVLVCGSWRPHRKEGANGRREGSVWRRGSDLSPSGWSGAEGLPVGHRESLQVPSSLVRPGAV